MDYIKRGGCPHVAISGQPTNRLSPSPLDSSWRSDSLYIFLNKQKVPHIHFNEPVILQILCNNVLLQWYMLDTDSTVIGSNVTTFR